MPCADTQRFSVERHMARHTQRDLEAGGEGLGVVETRKRLWQAIDGTVVKNRPWIAASEDRFPKRARRVSKKQAPAEVLSESVSVTPPCLPQVSSPTLSTQRTMLIKSTHPIFQYLWILMHQHFRNRGVYCLLRVVSTILISTRVQGLTICL